MSIRNKVTAMFVAILALIFGATGAALAAGSGTLTPNTVSTNGQLVHVTWSGLTAGARVIVQQCNNSKTAHPSTYDPNFDCSLVVSQQIDGTQYNSTGSGATGATAASGNNPDFSSLVGDEPTGQGWGCWSDGTPGGVLINGSMHYNPCLVRVTDTSYTTTTNEFFMPLNIAAPAPVVPEARYVVLLPLGAAAVLGAAFMIVRTRRRPAEA